MGWASRVLSGGSARKGVRRGKKDDVAVKKECPICRKKMPTVIVHGKKEKRVRDKEKRGSDDI